MLEFKILEKKNLTEVYGEDILLTFKGSPPFVAHPEDPNVPMGVLISRESDGKLLCYDCKKWFDHISTHVIGGHGYKNVAQYKEKYGFNRKAGLVSAAVSAKISCLSRSENKIKNIKGTRCPKGITRNSMQTKNSHNSCPAQYRERFKTICRAAGRMVSFVEASSIDRGLTNAFRGDGRWTALRDEISIELGFPLSKQMLSAKPCS